MDATRIVELLAPFLGSREDYDRARALAPSISTYIDILLRWNSRMNLTAIREPEQIVARHFGESFFAARHLFPDATSDAAPIKPSDAVRGLGELTEAAAKQRRKLADLGSGAGFPGIPIKLWVPQVAVTLIESNQKKSVFLREIARALILTYIDIQNIRAETLPQASFDAVTLRAVERFDRALPAAAALLVSQGRLALLIGAPQLPYAKSTLHGFVFADPLPIPESSDRVLVFATRL
jgi:16S rRNA (guanine527-N7)-methyltransferase